MAVLKPRAWAVVATARLLAPGRKRSFPVSSYLALAASHRLPGPGASIHPRLRADGMLRSRVVRALEVAPARTGGRLWPSTPQTRARMPAAIRQSAPPSRQHRGAAARHPKRMIGWARA